MILICNHDQVMSLYDENKIKSSTIKQPLPMATHYMATLHTLMTSVPQHDKNFTASLVSSLQNCKAKAKGS